MTNLEDDKGIVYSNCVRIGNWYEATQLEEYKLNEFLKQMKRGDLMLARFRKMGENLRKPTILTQATGTIAFGSKVALLAPHVPSFDPPVAGKMGLLLGGRISSNDISYSQRLEDGCAVVGEPELSPMERSTFVIASADYCNRDGKKILFEPGGRRAGTCQPYPPTVAALQLQALHVRYDPDPIPGVCGVFPLYLSQHAGTNTRWRVLPIQRNDITRFEQEGETFNVNTDVIINHCATNENLGISNHWSMGFYGKICAPLMKTCLDVYGKETANNIWQIYVPIAS